VLVIKGNENMGFSYDDLALSGRLQQQVHNAFSNLPESRLNSLSP
jgi:hypothetical protein